MEYFKVNGLQYYRYVAKQVLSDGYSMYFYIEKH